MTRPFRLTVCGSGEDGHRLDVAIPAASSLFTGHFPGRPILPGIAHLALAQWALGEIMGREVALAAVRSLKLRRPVVPGDLLELRIGNSGEDGWWRFEVHCGGAAASQGVIEVRDPAPLPSAGRDPGEIAKGGFPPPDALLPHGPPALLLRAVAEVAEGGIAAVAEVPPRHPLVADGRFPAFLALEAAAQAAAALEALGRCEAPGPRIGYLVGIRDARFTVPSLPAGRRLRVAARLTGGAFPLSVYAVTICEIGEIGEAGHELAAGTLSTFLAADA
jgi:3-hydroxymyristoyl/3-hydroxydecanoyl-(acyl carrier protein) dehydratase